jgi:hypothetical protein
MAERETVGIVEIDAAHGEMSAEGGLSRFEDARLVVVGGDELHVWFNGTHYIGDGTAAEVEAGDLFFRSAPELVIDQVVSVDTSVPTSEVGVTIEHLYGPLIDEGETYTDETSIDELTGELGDVAMGDPGPPTLLREVTD